MKKLFWTTCFSFKHLKNEEVVWVGSIKDRLTWTILVALISGGPARMLENINL